MAIRRSKGVLYLFLFGGAMTLAEAARRRKRGKARIGHDFHIARVDGYRRRFGVALRLNHFIPDRGILTSTNGDGPLTVTSLEIIREPGCFVTGSLIEMSESELEYMDMLEAVDSENPEAGFMKRIEVTPYVSPLPLNAKRVYAYSGTRASRKRRVRAVCAERAAIPEYYLHDALAAVWELGLELHPDDELKRRPRDLLVKEMEWRL